MALTNHILPTYCYIIMTMAPTSAGSPMLQRCYSLPATHSRIKHLDTVLKPLPIVPPNGIQHSVQDSKPHPVPRGLGGACGLPLSCLRVVTLHCTHGGVAVPATNGVELLVGLARTQPVRFNLKEQEQYVTKHSSRDSESKKALVGLIT